MQLVALLTDLSLPGPGARRTGEVLVFKLQATETGSEASQWMQQDSNRTQLRDQQFDVKEYSAEVIATLTRTHKAVKLVLVQ